VFILFLLKSSRNGRIGEGLALECSEGPGAIELFHNPGRRIGLFTSIITGNET
jgi:hypothetical protein